MVIYKKILFVLFLLFTLFFTRFYNLSATSRFTRDESSNLMDMHRIYVEKKITLIGPIDVANYVIYPSLTFYMLMPFAIFGDFSTFSPAYGTAFYGILAVLFLIYLTGKINKRLLIPISVLLVVWYPLVEAGRWAWNPHIVPFMSVLALIFWRRRGKWMRFLAGFCFGLVFHLHYFSLVSSAVFLSLAGMPLIGKKRLKEVFLGAFGFAVTIIPFVAFDLRNPPGLFFGRFLHNNLVTESFLSKLAKFGTTVPQNFYKSLLYLAQTQALAIIAGLLIFVVFVLDLRNKNKSLTYFLPFVAQIVAISLLPDFAGRYVLLGLVFFTIWLVFPRKKVAAFLSSLLILILIVGSLVHLDKLLTKPQMEPGAVVVEYASQVIDNSIKLEELKNVNLVVLGSPDPDPLGIIYRHTLLVKETRILSEGEYGITDNLFVITTSSESEIREDSASIMDGFRKGKMVKEEGLGDTNWKIYLFNRDEG